MKGSLLTAASSALIGASLVAAAHHNHGHAHLALHKRAGAPSPSPTTPNATYYGEAELVHAVVQPVEVKAPQPPTPKPEEHEASPPPPKEIKESHVPVQSDSASELAPPASSPSAPVSEGKIGGNGDQWCMTYSPYTDGGECKGGDEVSKDIANIAQKGFTSVRIYSTDCGGLEKVGSACEKHGLKIVAGVFIDKTGLGPAREQIQDLAQWKKWELVELIVIGNEALFNGFCTASQLADFIAEAKQTFKQAGYNGPCTTTEASVEILATNKATLCPVLDVVAANLHPFFNGAISASEAGDFVAKQMKGLEECCPGKETYNLETGWPSAGADNGVAIAGKSEQEEAIAGIRKAVGNKVAFFSFVDDLWKDDKREQSFGCGHLF
ncbi:MAG: hypothetical protein M1833_002653 [Piccolia ochrophora]|nr:MAG: hypothetical protein M1833_002653 [Piccolia ochrophora]